ncbi:MAG: succinate dehydrogenase / fumarate reductase, flavoprotein subunit, partial [Ilumatobacteraceae bacterium]
LGGNSLTETIVFGRRAGEAAAAFSAESDVAIHPRNVIHDADDELDEMIGPGSELARPLQRALRDVMWERCGVVRDETGLNAGLGRLDEIRGVIADVDVRPSAEGWSDLAQLIDLRAGLLVAEATMRGAIIRRESRGCHNRTEYTELDPTLQVNFYSRLGDGGQLVDPWSEAVAPVPDELVAWIGSPGSVEAGGRLLE